MRGALLFGAFGLGTAMLCASARAQIPDVRFRGDLTASITATKEDPALPRLYSTLGRYSTVGISIFLENGLLASVSQRLQIFSGDADDEILDAYTIEDPGIWKVGKQYLPFGSGLLLRESVRAVRADTDLIVEGLPIVVAAFDGGSGRPRGQMIRVGPRAYGLSVMTGEHIGVSGSALSIIRRPEGSPGLGRGWGQAYGADAAYRVGSNLYRAELLALRSGDLDSIRNRTILDLSFTRDIGRRNSVSLEAIADVDRAESFFRFSGQFETDNNIFLEPVLILRQGAFDRAGFGVRYRF